MLVQSRADLTAVDFAHISTDRCWTRDFCPIFVRDPAGRPVVLNWRFNGWAKYPNWQVDDAVPAQIAQRLKVREVQPRLRRRRIVLEGGSIDVNGAGSMLTTEECLLSDVQARNPGLTREELESVFREYLGVTNTLWLKNGIAGDDTHGHIDDLARFVGPSTVVIALERNRSDPNYETTQENYRLLRTFRDQDGNPLCVVPLPMPEPVYFSGQRLPASYANFYIANGLVLVPVFNDPSDRKALNILARVLPDRQVTGIASADLVLGLGTLHCLTQQQIAN
jgi:agmatine deiminase